MRIYNSGFYEVARVRHSVPRFRFTKDTSLAEWQRNARQNLSQLLGLPLQAGANTLKILYAREHPGFTEHRFELETEPGYFAQCYLLVPKDKSEMHKLCLCFGGHGSNMHITAGLPDNDPDRSGGELNRRENIRILSETPELNIASYALKSGRAALIVELRAFGEAGDDTPSCTENAKTALLMGRTLIGERVHDAICALDAVLSGFDIDPEGIIATGFSGGGSLAFYLSLLDERIALCAPSCSFCSFEKSIVEISHCLCNHIPGIRRDFEMGDLAGLIYPRRLIVAAGETDPIFPYDGVLDSVRLAREVYFCDTPDSLILLSLKDGHRYYGELIWQTINNINI
ncbi:MAG: hypothetical protein IJX58_04050 [Clostridia bacterium]|nr:hypothetical protein [Clostridia bacterium]